MAREHIRLMSIVKLLAVVTIVISAVISTAASLAGRGPQTPPILIESLAGADSGCTARPAMGGAAGGTAPWRRNCGRVPPT